MAFHLKLNESVHDGVQRVAKREIEKALEHLRSHGQEDEAIHEVRKSLKKVRAALRLVRDELGEAAYRRENFAFRDAARPLTEVRDAKIFVETLQNLIKDSAAEIDAHAFDKVHEALIENLKVVTERVLKEDRSFARVAVAIEHALARLTDWPINPVNQDGWQALEGGLRRVYRTGRRALAASTGEPTVENLHEWRKQAKYLWHQLQLVEPTWIASEKELGDQAHNLTRLLGDDHDLAVLRQLVTADPLVYGGHRLLKNLVTLIDRRRRTLEEKAFLLGREVYRDTPQLFTRRLEDYWKTWTAQARPQPPAARHGKPAATRPSRRALAR